MRSLLKVPSPLRFRTTIAGSISPLDEHTNMYTYKNAQYIKEDWMATGSFENPAVCSTSDSPLAQQFNLAELGKWEEVSSRQVRGPQATGSRSPVLTSVPTPGARAAGLSPR